LALLSHRLARLQMKGACSTDRKGTDTADPRPPLRAYRPTRLTREPGHPRRTRRQLITSWSLWRDICQDLISYGSSHSTRHRRCRNCWGDRHPRPNRTARRQQSPSERSRPYWTCYGPSRNKFTSFGSRVGKLERTQRRQIGKSTERDTASIQNVRSERSLRGGATALTPSLLLLPAQLAGGRRQNTTRSLGTTKNPYACDRDLGRRPHGATVPHLSDVRSEREGNDPALSRNGMGSGRVHRP